MMVPLSLPAEVDNAEAKALFEQGLRAQRSKQYLHAIEHYRHSCEASDDVDISFAGLMNIALCHGQLSDWSAADVSAREALSINPLSRTALEYLREICNNRGQPDEAQAFSELMLKI